MRSASLNLENNYPFKVRGFFNHFEREIEEINMIFFLQNAKHFSNARHLVKRGVKHTHLFFLFIMCAINMDHPYFSMIMKAFGPQPPIDRFRLSNRMWTGQQACHHTQESHSYHKEHAF